MNTTFSTYQEQNQLGSFLDEVRKVFRAELDHQITLASNEERIKDIENDAADAMEDNPNSVGGFKGNYFYSTKLILII